MSEVVEQAVKAYQAWMRDNLARAADHFALTLTGEPVWGWEWRSISTRAHGALGACWLRVGCEWEADLDSTTADLWTGNEDSNAIVGVTKPRVLSSTQWTAHTEPERRIRADVMTLLAGTPCSPTDVLRADLHLPDTWWAELRRSLDAVRVVPTTRFALRGGRTDRRVREYFGLDMPAREHQTGHGDLHWNNLFGPTFGLLDWEMWGVVPVGSDPAYLHACSLLAPETARRVYYTFADVLNSPAGRIAQVRAAARLLHHAGNKVPGLVESIRKHVQPILDQTAKESAEP
ncbi:MAG: aminoglycoside phosphotransferase [Pseudonocardiaceae bacterium]